MRARSSVRHMEPSRQAGGVVPAGSQAWASGAAFGLSPRCRLPPLPPLLCFVPRPPLLCPPLLILLPDLQRLVVRQGGMHVPGAGGAGVNTAGSGTSGTWLLLPLPSQWPALWGCRKPAINGDPSCADDVAAALAAPLARCRAAASCLPTSPPSKNSFFQMGTVALSSSMAQWHACVGAGVGVVEGERGVSAEAAQLQRPAPLRHALRGARRARLPGATSSARVRLPHAARPCCFRTANAAARPRT